MSSRGVVPRTGVTPLTYANVMSSLAVFLVIGGATALAAGLAKNSVGTKQLKKNAVTTAKNKNNAVTTGKLKDSAVTGGKLADASVTGGKVANEAIVTAKIANGAVDASKLAESERSQAFQSEVSPGTQNLANGLIGEYGIPQSVTSLNLPGGNYVVSGQSDFTNADVGENHDLVCRLVDDGNELGEQSTTALPGLLFPSAAVNVIGISNGGRVDLACRQGATNKVSAFKAYIVSIRVGSVTGP
jgi:hypothetical protein